MKNTFPILLLIALFFSTLTKAQVPYIKTIAGTGTPGFSGDGFAAAGAELNAPQGVSVDDMGNVYILDFLNFRIRKVNTSGSIFTVAGNGGIGYTGDGSVGTSAEVRPFGIAVDKNSNIYISDASHGVIRKVNAIGIISTFAGNGIQGNTGNGGPATAAKIVSPQGMTFDSSGNMYFTDGVSDVVRKISPAGIITRFAGNDTSGYAGDGDDATLARLDSPYAVVADHRGNVFISDMRNNVIRKVNAAGVITTYAGVAGIYGNTGDGGPAVLAHLNRPAGLAVDVHDNIYVADADNNVIRMIDTGGIITTVVGNGTPGFGGDLGPVNGCNLHTPFGVAVDGFGNIYIADANNQRIRATYSPTAVANVNNAAKVVAYPNPTKNGFYMTGVEKSDVIEVHDVTGKVVNTYTVTAANQLFNTNNLTPGVYLLQVSDASRITRKTVTTLVKE